MDKKEAEPVSIIGVSFLFIAAGSLWSEEY